MESVTLVNMMKKGMEPISKVFRRGYMLCFLAAYMDKDREMKMSSFEAQTENSPYVVEYIVHTLEGRDFIPLAVFQLEGEGYTNEEYDRMVEMRDFPPYDMVYMAPELAMAQLSIELGDEMMTNRIH